MKNEAPYSMPTLMLKILFLWTKLIVFSNLKCNHMLLVIYDIEQ